MATDPEDPDSDDGREEPDDILARAFHQLRCLCRAAFSNVIKHLQRNLVLAWRVPIPAIPPPLAFRTAADFGRATRRDRSCRGHRDGSETDQKQRRWPALSVAALHCRPVLPAPPLARPSVPSCGLTGVVWCTNQGRADGSDQRVQRLQLPQTAPGRGADKAWPVAAPRDARSASAPRRAEGNRRETRTSNPT